ncbi:MAG TPA: zinc-binding dehydrogenase [Ktedonobacteraceae bacterium]|nr:zinc-binding dehydrogenase [Ktedonobacteraceae bacterium]
MLAALLFKPLDLRLEEQPVPQPEAGEVLLQVAAATTCGTDLKAFRRGHPVLFQRLPARFGHEVAGIVAATGAGVTVCKEGDAVVVANSAPCQQCFYCRRGQLSLCEDLLFLNGAYAEYLLIPARIVRLNLYRLPPTTSYIAAALTEPLACALHGIDASNIHAGDTIAILGAGPLGLLLAAVASRRGAHVIVTGRGSERLALARLLGASVVVDVTGRSLDEQYELVREETEQHRGVDVAIEAVGSSETWELAARLVRPGGLVNFFGGCPSGTQVTLPTRPLHYSELTLKGVFHHTPAYFAQALELINDHQIEVEALVTACYPLSSLLEVFALLQRKQGIKYALIPPAFAQTLTLAANPE